MNSCVPLAPSYTGSYLPAFVTDRFTPTEEEAKWHNIIWKFGHCGEASAINLTYESTWVYHRWVRGM